MPKKILVIFQDLMYEEINLPVDYVEYARSEELFRTFSGRIEAVGISTSQKVLI
jgi:sulfate adenylyltransferase subunit 1 (EFTu-like GTPase family)